MTSAAPSGEMLQGGQLLQTQSPADAQRLVQADACEDTLIYCYARLRARVQSGSVERHVSYILTQGLGDLMLHINCVRQISKFKF